MSPGRIAHIADTPDLVREPRHPRALQPGPFTITLRDVTVRYHPDGPPALDRVSLDLPPGRRIALVGANGAGKSTLARARLLPWIRTLPHGWDTRVGTHGAAVSGGERQRIALARALLADPTLLILDEATAHLDRDTRQALTADLLQATESRAVLFITHDVDGLDQVDQIVVLDHGRVAEQGGHHELRHAGGRYQRMWESDW